MKTKICAVALAIAAAAPAIADDFTYVSGGLLYQFHSKEHAWNRTIDKNGKVETKNNDFGFYLNGSSGINDYLFVEGRLHDTKLDRQVLLGVGGHYPVAQCANLYALAGIAKKNITTLFDENSQAAGEHRGNIQPTIELGAKLRANDAIGARVSYRYAQFGDKNLASNQRHLHEGHLGGYYQVAESCAVEAGYNFTRFMKDVNDHKITTGIRYSF
ncbi:MAG: outer membrane beta-barrel protein [Candidatus Symbiodolus clandestinus]